MEPDKARDDHTECHTLWREQRESLIDTGHSASQLALGHDMFFAGWQASSAHHMERIRMLEGKLASRKEIAHQNHAAASVSQNEMRELGVGDRRKDVRNPGANAYGDNRT